MLRISSCAPFVYSVHTLIIIKIFVLITDFLQLLEEQGGVERRKDRWLRYQI